MTPPLVEVQVALPAVAVQSRWEYSFAAYGMLVHLVGVSAGMQKPHRPHAG